MFGIKLLPHDRIFFILFNNLSQILVLIVTEFNALMNDYPDHSENHVKMLQELEEKGNSIAEEQMIELFSNFITPLDREDIHELTKILNDIIDHIHGVGRRFDMYNVKSIKPEAIAMGDILLSCVKELVLLISTLNNMNALEKITPAIDNLKELEQKGDVIYRQAIRELFHNTDYTTLEVITWKDLFERIENNIDKCNDAGNLILGIILKYA